MSQMAEIVAARATEFTEFFDFRVSTEHVPFSLLLKSSLVPVVKVLLVGLVGLVCSLPSVNLLSPSSRKALSKLVYCIFLPAFIFVYLGEAIDLRKLFLWWFLPVNVIITSIIGSVLGLLVAKVTGAPSEYWRLIAVLTGIGNQGSMPIVLITAICTDPRNPFGGPQTCDVAGVAYMSLGMWMAAILMWGVVYNVLSPPSSPPSSFSPTVLVKEPSLKAPHRVPSIADDLRQLEEGSLTVPLLPSSLSLPPLVALPLATTTRLLQSHQPVGVSVLSVLLRPPLFAACLAMLIGITPALDHVMFNPDGQLRFATDTAAIFGHALVPCILMVIGGNMASAPTSSNLPPWTTFGIVAARAVGVPLAGMAVLGAAARFGLIPPHDPMFRFALLLQSTMPASVEIGTCCSLHGFGEKEASSVFFFQHVVAAVSMPLFMVLYLYMLFG